MRNFLSTLDTGTIDKIEPDKLPTEKAAGDGGAALPDGGDGGVSQGPEATTTAPETSVPGSTSGAHVEVTTTAPAATTTAAAATVTAGVTGNSTRNSTDMFSNRTESGGLK